MTRRRTTHHDATAVPEHGATATAGRIFKIIRDRGPLGAADIVRLTGLAKSTVSVNIDRLLESGLVREEAKPESKRKNLKVAENAGFVVGVDIGQTHLAVGLCDLEAVVVGFRKIPLDLVHETPEAVLEKTGALIAELTAAAGVAQEDLFGMGVGVPGPVDFDKGIPVSPPVMPGWDRFPVTGFLAERFRCPVFLDNDANVMALGERDRGAAQGVDSFLFVKIGTGIGGGLVVHGEIYRGAKGAAGDIGHIAIDGDETACRCGNKGCLEVVAGGEALLRRAGVSDLTSLGLGISSGNDDYVRLLMESGRSVGSVLAKLVNFFNPAMIVVGGRLVHLGERYIASIREAIYRRSTPLATSDLVVKKSVLGEECGVVGAAVLVLDEILSHRNVSKIVGGTSYGSIQ